jgi:hypothetical protein
LVVGKEWFDKNYVHGSARVWSSISQLLA